MEEFAIGVSVTTEKLSDTEDWRVFRFFTEILGAVGVSQKIIRAPHGTKKAPVLYQTPSASSGIADRVYPTIQACCRGTPARQQRTRPLDHANARWTVKEVL
jgi:hypothetical protein